MKRVAILVLVAALLVVPWVPHLLYPVFVMKLLCMALFACAYGLLLGFGGMMSFGHAAFFGSAAYLTGLAAKTWGLPPELALLVGTAFAAGLGAVFGALAIHRQGIYLAMITLALAQMVYFFSLQAPFTGGEDGIQSVPRGALFGVIDLNTPMAMYMLVLVIFLAGFLFVWRVVHSPFGQVLQAIRENEARATSLGYDTDRYKHLAFVLSAGLSGLAGAMKAIVFQVADAEALPFEDASFDAVLSTFGVMFTPDQPKAAAELARDALCCTPARHVGAGCI